MGQKETSDAWFKKGYWFGRSDPERGANEGLSKREIRALAEENNRPWGRKQWAKDHVSKRAAAAQKAAKDKGKKK